MKYAFLTVYKSWLWILAGAILCAGILVAITAGFAALLLPEAIAVPGLTPIICPAETDFVVGKYSYTLPGEQGIDLEFACVDAAGRDHEVNDVLIIFTFVGSLTLLFFAVFSLWLFISTWKRVAKNRPDGPQ
jgi:hypothetical protein